MIWKLLTTAGKPAHVNLSHVAFMTIEDGKTRIHFCIATGGAETRHSTIVVDETPEQVLSGVELA